MPKEKLATHLLSSNLEYLRGIVELVEKYDDASKVLKTFPMPAQDETYGQTNNTVCVDVVRCSEKLWVKVVAKNAQSLHLIWAGQGNYGKRNILDQAKLLQKIAKLYPVNYKPPQICLHFRNGITKELKSVLEQNNFIVELSENSSIESVSADTLRRLTLFNDYDSSDSEGEHSLDNDKIDVLYPDISELQKCNLDITALICLVSNLNTTQGCLHEFPSSKILAQQAKDELENPTLPSLNAFIVGKELYVCKTALNSFTDILHTIGGETEKQRGKELMEKIIVIEDSCTEKSNRLLVKGQIKTRAKTIFATGDSIQAVTITANLAFVRAAQNQNVNFVIHSIKPRALSEQKE